MKWGFPISLLSNEQTNSKEFEIDENLEKAKT